MIDFQENIKHRQRILQAAKPLVEKFIELTEEEWLWAMDHAKTVCLPTSTRISDYGEIDNRVCLIVKGCVVSLYKKGHKEIPVHFYMEGEFVGNPVGYLMKSPSPTVLETFEDCELAYISESTFNFLAEKNKTRKSFREKLLATALIETEKRHYMQMYSTPEEKYTWLLDNKPEMLQRVPQNLIASMLGITAVSLSRIRRRLSRQNKN